MRALVVEDDASIAEFVQRGLREAGFAVDRAADGDDALELAVREPYDVAIVDLMLPKRDGLSLIEELRRRGITMPVLILSARRSVDDRVRGLQSGGDDYLTKPFAFAELIARIQALARRPPVGRPPVLEHGGVMLDIPRHQAFRDGRLLELTPKEFAVLSVLMHSAGTVVSAEQLLEQAWDEHADPFTNAVRVAVMTLRRKLGAPPIVHTVPRVGYRFGD
jgi:DNA-binding response OmpR family regulator